jgi:hypothetical protein
LCILLWNLNWFSSCHAFEAKPSNSRLQAFNFLLNLFYCFLLYLKCQVLVCGFWSNILRLINNITSMVLGWDLALEINDWLLWWINQHWTIFQNFNCDCKSLIEQLSTSSLGIESWRIINWIMFLDWLIDNPRINHDRQQMLIVLGIQIVIVIVPSCLKVEINLVWILFFNIG